MKAPLASLCLTAGALAIAGCAVTREQVTVLKPVGPVARAPAFQSHPLGYLVAYTPVILPPMNSTTLFYPHSPYAIYDAHGALLQEVKNHVGAWDETPERVCLPAGRYTLRTQSDSPGELVVPILIRGSRTTVVDLARDNRYFVTSVNPG